MGRGAAFGCALWAIEQNQLKPITIAQNFTTVFKSLS
jgi:hypothetical protein